MDTFTNEMIKQDRERLRRVVDYVELLMESKPLGWICPNCGKGLAPDVKECSCSEEE